jgi:hypothetical protein
MVVADPHRTWSPAADLASMAVPQPSTAARGFAKA